MQKADLLKEGLSSKTGASRVGGALRQGPCLHSSRALGLGLETLPLCGDTNHAGKVRNTDAMSQPPGSQSAVPHVAKLAAKSSDQVKDLGMRLSWRVWWPSVLTRGLTGGSRSRDKGSSGQSESAAGDAGVPDGQ